MDSNGTVTSRWESLVNPERDLGPQRIHGIRAQQVLDAPTFAELTPTIHSLLTDRVFVAHNARFDVEFLHAEFRRLGATGAPIAHSECTMLLAREFLPGVGRNLADCCNACGIDIGAAHRASADAQATAELLGIYLALDPAVFGSALSRLPIPRTRSSSIPLHPGVAREATTLDESDFLSRLVNRLPDISGPDAHQQYLALLDRCLLDRKLSALERRQLVGLADQLGIGRPTAQALHGKYLSALAAVALADNVLTDDEHAGLHVVARLLSLSAAAVDAALAACQTSVPDVIDVPTQRALQPGTVVVLTGEMRKPRSQWTSELEARGFVAKPAVTKAVDLVVAADPDTLSGKAKKARDYGIPVVSEHWLAAELGL